PAGWPADECPLSGSAQPGGYGAGDVGVGGVEVVGGGVRFGEVGGDEDRLAVWRPGDGDVVGGAVDAGAGLVADDPLTGEAGAQAFEGGGGLFQPAGEPGATVRGQYVVTQQDAVHGSGHGARRRRVALVAGQVRVQVRLVAVEARNI